jgi:hypothetical protein
VATSQRIDHQPGFLLCAKLDQLVGSALELRYLLAQLTCAALAFVLPVRLAATAVRVATVWAALARVSSDQFFDRQSDIPRPGVNYAKRKCFNEMIIGLSTQNRLIIKANRGRHL